jgi:hypothetical protein
MGDCNAPATCMRIMHTIFYDAIRRWMHVYLNDILVVSPTYATYHGTIPTAGTERFPIGLL